MIRFLRHLLTSAASTTSGTLSALQASRETPQNEGRFLRTPEDQQYDLQRNAEINAAQVPPKEERVVVPMIWVFEALTPSTVENLGLAVEKLGWDEESDFVINAGFVDAVADMRRSAHHGSWLNLGWIVPRDRNRWAMNRVADLPKGVEAVAAHIVQFVPSVTFLAFAFRLEDDLAASVDEVLREAPGSWEERTPAGTRLHSAEHIKLALVEGTRGALRSMCMAWVSETFPGYFTLHMPTRLPTAEVILLSQRTPVSAEDAGIYGDYLRVLGLGTPQNRWEAREWKGMYVSFPGDAFGEPERMVIAGRISDVVHSGETRQGQSDLDDILGHLFWWHRTIATWGLDVMAHNLQQSLGALREDYGRLILVDHSTTEALDDLNRRLLDLERDGVPFAEEVKKYCENERSFLHDVQEFSSVDPFYLKRDKDLELMRSIRRHLLQTCDSFLTRMEQLRRIGDRTGTLAATLAANRLSGTNVKLARTNLWLQAAVFILTTVMLALAWAESRLDHSQVIRALRRTFAVLLS